MPSRRGTAASKSKSGTRASNRKSRGGTRGRVDEEEDEDDDEYDDDDDDDDSEVTGTAGRSRGGTTAAGKSKSLFDADKSNKAGDDDGNEGVKANDIWSKFVSDDQDVVRAPTADSEDSGLTRSSQRSHGTGITHSQGSQRPSQIDEEEEEEEESSSDDDRTIYSDYYLPPEYMREEGTPGPRAEIVDSHEACSCFPNRSDKFKGAMLYDKVTCVHTGLVGHTQPGVFKFNPYWNDNMEEPRKMRKRDMRIARTKFVFGYPKPRFELVSESEEEYEEDDDSEEDDDDSEQPPKTAAKSLKTATHRAKTQDTDEEDDDDEYDSEYDSDEDYDDDDDEEDEDFIPFQLPQIGLPKTPSLPPSRDSFRSVYSEYSESVPDSLPSLPASRQLTAQTRRTGVTQRTQKTHFTLPQSQRDTKTAKSGKTQKSIPKSKQKAKSIDSGYDEDVSRRTAMSRQSLPDGPVIGQTRTFQGKFYDPVTKQVMLYDIGSRPGQRIPGGNLEPLNKPPTAQSVTRKQTPRKDGTGSKPGTQGSKRNTTSQQSHHSIPKAAVLGAVFISNLLSKNKAKKEALEAGYSDEDENA